MTAKTMRRVVAAAVAVVAVSGISGLSADARPFPDRVDLPNGFRPEGIVVGRGSTFYVGSLADGALYRGDLRTGDGEVVFAGEGSPTVGLAVDQRERVFAAGGDSGQARVIDGRTGKVLATYQLTGEESFVNDVVVAGGSAWFTDSVNQVLYRVPLDLGPAETIPLSGDLVYEPGFNVNGIEATPDGHTLVLVQSNTGELFTADPSTGVTHEIDLGGEAITNGDGLLLDGRTLYVVQNFSNLVATVEVSPDLMTATVTGHFGDDEFDVPTTVDRFGNGLYFVNARFMTTPTPTTSYWITRVDR